MLALVDFYASGHGGSDYEDRERDPFWALFSVDTQEDEVEAALATWLAEVLDAHDAYPVQVVTINELIDYWEVDGQVIRTRIATQCQPHFSSKTLLALIAAGLNGDDEASNALRRIVENINP